jgi:hypothetical protein
MTWRYQAVWRKQDGIPGGERVYSVCEVYFDDDGRLAHWTEDPAIAASGETWDELQHDLGKMYEDVWSWMPVSFAELRPGMTFERNPRSDKARRGK